MRVRTGSMRSLPYSIEINDFNAFLFQGQTGEQFAQTIRAQFDGCTTAAPRPAG